VRAFKLLKDWVDASRAVDRHNVANLVLVDLNYHHGEKLPTEDVIAIFEEVEQRLTEALKARREEITQELHSINEYLLKR